MADEQRIDSLHSAIEPWISELRAFASGRMTPQAFVDFYDDAFRHHDRWWSDDVFDQLSALWAAADDYVADPGLRRLVDLATGPEELRDRVRRLLELAGYPPA